MSDLSGPGVPGEDPAAPSPGAGEQAPPPRPPRRPAASGTARKPAPRKPKAADGEAEARPARPASGAAKAAAKASTPRTPRGQGAARSAGAATGRGAAAASRASTSRQPASEAKPATVRKPAAAAKSIVSKALTGPQPVPTVDPVTEPAPQVAPDPILDPAPEAVLESVPERSDSPVEPAVRVAVSARGAADVEPVLVLEALTRRFGDYLAVDDLTLSLDPGTFTGIVGPNGAGKTTTLSMITGLLRPTSGRVLVAGIDVWRHPQRAKHQLGVLPDRLHTFDRLTGGQLLYYTGVLHGLDRATARRRTNELAEAFKVEHAMGRLVTDYSSGMLKKIALAAALIHAPRMLVLDEPFESVDPVSAMTVAQILRDFAAGGGTVLMSSHSMELVQRICDHVAVIVDGRLIAGGTVDEVRGDQSLQERFIDLAGADAESIADLTWLRRFSG